MNQRIGHAFSRRGFLASATAVALTGCVGNPSALGGDDNLSIATSFFMPYDATRTIASDSMVVEDLVPIGEHGHDWDPDPGIVRDIESADAFVYTRGFSSWQDNAATSLREDGNVLVIEVSEGIDFIDSPAEDNDEHFWLNPLRMKDGLENIEAGLLELDPDHADTIESQAAAFKDELESVHHEFQDLADRRTQDQIIIGSHDSFQWWWDQYGFDIYSPVGISPDDEASARDIEEVERLIEEHDIQYILYDLLEPKTLAESLAAETGTELLPLSPAEGQTQELIDEGIDTYLNHQREINLTTLAHALEVE